MLIQTTSPRPMINTAESPKHVRIHTMRKLKVSTGTVTFVVHEKQIDVEPYAVYPIQGEAGFEALDYYLPFWNVFGTNRPEYNEDKIRSNIEAEAFHRVDVTDKGKKPAPTRTKLLVTDTDAPPPEREKLTGVELAILGSTGYHVIVKSAYRTEGAAYEERVFNFTIHCAVNGAGMIRIANCPVDIANPTFDPYAPEPGGPRKDLVLLEAFNRTHKPRTDSIEERRRARIAEAEANIRLNEGKALGSGDTKRLPESSDSTVRGHRIIRRDD